MEEGGEKTVQGVWLGEETWENLLEECTDWGREKGWQETVVELLRDEREG